MPKAALAEQEKWNSFEANETIVALKGVKHAAGQTIDQIDTAGENGIGIAQDGGTAGAGITVCQGGECHALSGAAYADLANLMFDAEGRLITATTGNVVVAEAREAATGADERRLVLVLRPSQVLEA